MKVAMVQMNSQPDPQRNLLLVEHFFREAAAAGASLITFPENFLAMGAGSSQIAHTDWQAIIERLPRLHRASPSAFLDKLNGKERGAKIGSEYKPQMDADRRR